MWFPSRSTFILTTPNFLHPLSTILLIILFHPHRRRFTQPATSPHVHGILPQPSKAITFTSTNCCAQMFRNLSVCPPVRPRLLMIELDITTHPLLIDFHYAFKGFITPRPLVKSAIHSSCRWFEFNCDSQLWFKPAGGWQWLFKNPPWIHRITSGSGQ